jgi:hypothetical protein
MRNFSKVDKGNIRINSLFFQPVNYCSYNCSGCYIKERASTDELITTIFWSRLQKIFADDSSPHSANQITLSVDSLPSNTTAVFQETIAVYMKTVFYNFLKNAWYLKTEKRTSTEFHITVHDPISLSRYMADNSGKNLYIEALDLISFSHLFLFSDKSKGKLFSNIFPEHTKINFNLISSEGFLKNFDQYRYILEEIDYIYLILKKPDLGKHISQEDRDLFWKAYELISKDSSLSHKLSMDTCVKDAEKYGLTGYGCSANISKFQINPNGAVAGCPYSSINNSEAISLSKYTVAPSHVDTIEELMEMTLASIRYSNKQYDFKRCKIPQDLFPELPYNELKQNLSLRIIED